MKFIMILSILLCSSLNGLATTMKIDEKKSVITWHGEKKVGAKHFGTIAMTPNQTLEFEIVTDSKNRHPFLLFA